MKRTLQVLTQILFLVLFIILIITGRVQLWVGVFLITLAAALLVSRIYCGWICPINTVMRGVSWLKKQLKLKSIPIPAVMMKPWLRYFVLLLFLATFAMAMITGRKLPVLPVLFFLGTILTLFFPEELWHRYLCPYGTLMSITGSQARVAMQIDQEKCNSCGICLKVCPAGAVNKDDRFYSISKGDCIVCTDCAISCKQNAIGYYKLGAAGRPKA